MELFFFFLELFCWNGHCSCLFRCNSPISLCTSNCEVLTILLKMIIVFKKNTFIQLLAQHHFSNSRWLGINSLYRLCYFEEEI